MLFAPATGHISFAKYFSFNMVIRPIPLCLDVTMAYKHIVV